MTDSNDIAAPAIKTPHSVKWVAAIGIPVSLAAAAAVSFAGLTELGGFAGIDHPWLMPVAIDVYATTATLIAMLLPEGHHARRTAVWHARLGLAMSMSGNAVARALHLGARGYTGSDAILTFIGAWPSLIVERLLHLQGRLVVTETGADKTATPAADWAADKTAESADDAPTATADIPVPAPRATADAAPTAPQSAPKTAPNRRRVMSATADGGRATGADSTAGTVTDIGAARRSIEEWTALAEPLYRRHLTDTGEHPSGPQLAALLAQAGHGQLGSSRARDVRAAVEKIVKGDAQAETEPEQERRAG